MEPVRDHPLSRFTSFWWALGVFLLAALGIGVFALLNLKSPATLEDEAAKTRYEIRAKVEAAEAASLKPGTLAAGMDKIASAIATEKPVAVEKPEQIVPNSARSKALASAPGPDLAAIDKPAADPNAPIDPAVMALGKTGYALCSACHGAEGQGVPMLAPPLAGSDIVGGPVSNLIRIQLRGLTGPLTVSGKDYNLPAPMAALAFQTDEQIAAVLTYVRNSHGNKAPAVTADQVKALRSEVGKPPLTAADLVKP